MARRSSAVQFRSRQRRPGDTFLSPDDRAWAEKERARATSEAEESAARVERLNNFNPPMLGPRPVVPQMGTALPGGPDPERRVIPSVDDPIRNAPPPPPVSARQTRQDPSLSRPVAPETGPTGSMQGKGGPLVQDEQDKPWLNDPIVKPAPATGQAAGPKPWENDPIITPAPARPTTVGKPYNPDNIDTMLDEIVKDIPGGYKAWLEENNPPKPGMEWVRDPLSQEEKYYQAPIDRPRTQEGVTQEWQEQGKAAEAATDAANEEPWNEQVASALDEFTEFVLAPLTTGRETERQNDPVQAATNVFVKPGAELPALAFRDPVAAYQQVDPTQQAALAYNNAQSALGDVFEGDWKSAGDKALTGLQQAGGAALGIYGLKSAIGTNKLPARPLTVAEGRRAAASGLPPPPKQALARVPSINKAGRTLATAVLPTSLIRPQAAKALTRVLRNSNIPDDRIAAGLVRIVEGLKSLPDDSPITRATVAQFLAREFGPDFPEAVQNIGTVLLERRQSKSPKDRSSSIIRSTAQEMRETQVPFLQERANKNLGGQSKRGTRQEVAENLRLMGEEGYEPILSQPIDQARTAQIQGVLQGPGMSELGRPLRQIAAGEGKDIDAMIAQDPLRAAHWMQHKALSLQQENAGKGNTALANAYGDMRGRILATLDDLTTPEGKTYAQLRKEYGDEARITTALDSANTFGTLARNPEKADKFVEDFEAMTPPQQEAALASVRDWIDARLRGSGENSPARMGELQAAGVLETLDRLGPQGKAMADDIRAIRGEEQFLGGILPRSESATANNLISREDAPALYSSGVANAVPTNLMGDAAMMATGLSTVPILTAMRHGPKWAKRMFMPKRQTLEDMTRVLMARPANKSPISQMVEGAKSRMPPPPPPVGAKAAPPPFKPIEGAERIDTTSWTPTEFNAARKQLNEMMRDRRTMSGQQLAELDSEITSLRNALELDGPPAEFADVPMASRFNQPVDIPWKKGSPESIAIEKAIEGKNWTVRSVPLEKVIPTQDSVFFDYAKSAARYAGDEKLPIVVKQGGQYYVADGHHRMMAQTGEGPIRARVIDLDAGTSKLPPPPPPPKKN